MRGLFGEELPDVDPPRAAGGGPRKARPDMAHAAKVGSGPEGQTCKTCAHLARKGTAGSSGKFFGCGLVRSRWTSGPGTDIRAKDPACAKWEPKAEENPSPRRIESAPSEPISIDEVAAPGEASGVVPAGILTRSGEAPSPAPSSSPLVAISDGGQDVDGFAPLEGRELPAGFRAWLPAGWTQPGPIAACEACKRGCVTVDPSGKPRHVNCERAAGVSA